MKLLKVKIFGRLFAPIAVVLLALTVTSNAEARKSIFSGTPTEDQCRGCHGDNSVQPHPRLQISNKDVHHARIGQPIIGLAIGSNDTVAPGDVSWGEYKCTSCHAVENSETQQYEMHFTKDCLECHSASSVTGKPWRGNNVHHYTDAFQNRDCSSCHRFSLDSSSTSNLRTNRSRMNRR